MTKHAGRDFMRNTCYDRLEVSGQERGLPQPPLEIPVPEGAKRIALPRPEDLEIPAMDLREAIEQRKSWRKYREEALNLEELSFLLWCTQGIKTVTNRPVTFRTVPSAGARHAFETYLLVNRVSGVEPGLYRYIASEHALLPLNLESGLPEKLSEACMKQSKIIHSAVSFFWVAVRERMYWRYGERGYRYLHLDAGHVCQNLYLSAEPIDCGICGIAAFDDALLNAALNLDGEELFVVYAASLGKKLR